MTVRNNKARRSYNNKRRFARAVPSMEQCKRLAAECVYGGSPYHKRNPGDYGLNPPAAPRPDKTLCDHTGIFKKAAALELLREGIRRGLISDFPSGVRFPELVWAVTQDGIPLEAQLDNAEAGSYHGYPLDEYDPFGPVVLRKWNEA